MLLLSYRSALPLASSSAHEAVTCSIIDIFSTLSSVILRAAATALAAENIPSTVYVRES